MGFIFVDLCVILATILYKLVSLPITVQYRSAGEENIF